MDYMVAWLGGEMIKGETGEYIQIIMVMVHTWLCFVVIW